MEPIPEFDLYRELEVDPRASRETIEAAWRSLVKRYHPDTAVERDVAEYRVRRLNIAHDWLADPARRARYDRERGVDRGTGWAAAPPSDPARTSTEPPQREAGAVPPEQAGTRAERPTLLVVAAGAALAALAVAVLVGLARQPSAAPAAASDTRRAAESATSAAASPSARPSASYDAHAEAARLLALIPERVSGRRLTREAAAGGEPAAAPDADSVDELAARLGRQPSDVAFAYGAAPATRGELLTIMAFSVRATAPSVLLDAFRAQTTSRTPGITWTRTTLGGRDVWVSPDASDPSVVAHAWAGNDAMFLVISNDDALADAAIRAVP